MGAARHSTDELAVYPARNSPTFPIRNQQVTAILVDGGFYRRRARVLFGKKDPDARAQEVVEYCKRHVRKTKSKLYRIFYYDCPPSEKVVYHPLLKQQINLAKTDDHAWMTAFHRALTRQRKPALRRGETLESQTGFNLKPGVTKKLLAGSIDVHDLTERDFDLDLTQKGVDMRIGLDIAALASNGAVNQIIMISGDSDFVPAAKLARRQGLDFVLDPLWSRISESLHEHIDGLWECVRRPPDNLRDPLHVDYASPDDQASDDEITDADL